MNPQALSGELRKLGNMRFQTLTGRGKVFRIKEVLPDGKFEIVVIIFEGGKGPLTIDAARWQGALSLLADGKPHRVGANKGWAIDGSVERASQDASESPLATATWTSTLLVKIGWAEVTVKRPQTIRLTEKGLGAIGVK